MSKECDRFIGGGGGVAIDLKPCIIEQNGEIIVEFMVKAPNLAQ